MNKLLLSALIIFSGLSGAEVKLTPQVKLVEIANEQKNIVTKNIRPFLRHTTVISSSDYKKAAKVISIDKNRLIGMDRSTVHIANLKQDFDNKTLGVFKLSKIDVQKDKIYQLRMVSKVRIENVDEVSEGTIFNSTSYVENGFVVMPIPVFNLPYNLTVKSPKIYKQKIKILTSTQDKLTYKNNDVVTLDVGSKEGSQVGDIYDIYEKPSTVNKNNDANAKKKKIYKIFGAKKAKALVYLVHDRISEALILESKKPVFLTDILRPGKINTH